MTGGLPVAIRRCFCYHDHLPGAVLRRYGVEESEFKVAESPHPERSLLKGLG